MNYYCKICRLPKFLMTLIDSVYHCQCGWKGKQSEMAYEIDLEQLDEKWDLDGEELYYVDLMISAGDTLESIEKVIQSWRQPEDGLTLAERNHWS